MRRYTAHLHTASAGDTAGGQVHIQQPRRLLCVLAVELKEIAHLKQHEVVRVGFLYGIVVIPCCASLCGLPLKLLKARLFLRRQETVFADQLRDTLGDVRPVQLDFRTVLLFQHDALAAVVFVAVGRIGNRVGAASNAVFFFQKVRLFLGGMLFFEIGVDSALAALYAASSGQHCGNLVLGDKPLHRGKLCHFGVVVFTGQIQLLQALPNLMEFVEVEAHEASVLLICRIKLRKLAGERFTKSRIGQAFGKSFRFVGEAPAPQRIHAGEVALLLRFLAEVVP